MAPHFSDIIAQDIPAGNDGDMPGFATPISQSEIEELLYSEEWPTEERTARLVAMREQLVEMEGSDIGDGDPLALIAQIDGALATLRDSAGEGMDPTSVDHDPSAHRETLAPDSDELEAIEEADANSFTEDSSGPIDEAEWIDGDGFDPDKGVR